jgi:hypothetical protein
MAERDKIGQRAEAENSFKLATGFADITDSLSPLTNGRSFATVAYVPGSTQTPRRYP